MDRSAGEIHILTEYGREVATSVVVFYPVSDSSGGPLLLSLHQPDIPPIDILFPKPRPVAELKLRTEREIELKVEIGIEIEIQESFARFRTAFGDEEPWKTTTYNWFPEFKRGRVNLSDEFRDDRPFTAVNNKNIDSDRVYDHNRRAIYAVYDIPSAYRALVPAGPRRRHIRVGLTNCDRRVCFLAHPSPPGTPTPARQPPGRRPAEALPAIVAHGPAGAINLVRLPFSSYISKSPQLVHTGVWHDRKVPITLAAFLVARRMATDEAWNRRVHQQTLIDINNFTVKVTVVDGPGRRLAVYTFSLRADVRGETVPNYNHISTCNYSTVNRSRSVFAIEASWLAGRSVEMESVEAIYHKTVGRWRRGVTAARRTRRRPTPVASKTPLLSVSFFPSPSAHSFVDQLYIHTHIRTQTRTCARVCVPSSVRASMLACVRACVRACMLACVRVCVRARARTYANVCVGKRNPTFFVTRANTSIFDR
ncbi:hypothetical protein EVAR_88329_1 [Eumeta japonica]|uniref:Uncharacterized protein n=1 Tax=Eumeta variegata TaxID=151549 RepID=A0A4C1VLD8_EUMVA|nr:hypothetical protein EVAR_88329_1 [Eumeta japonica]